MTNEQTLILLKKLKAELENAVEKSESLMPDSERKTIKRHGVSLASRFCMPLKKCENPEHYYDSTEIPALYPIYDVIESLKADIDLLTPKEDGR